MSEWHWSPVSVGVDTEQQVGRDPFPNHWGGSPFLSLVRKLSGASPNDLGGPCSQTPCASRVSSWAPLGRTSSGSRSPSWSPYTHLPGPPPRQGSPPPCRPRLVREPYVVLVPQSSPTPGVPEGLTVIVTRPFGVRTPTILHPPVPSRAPDVSPSDPNRGGDSDRRTH